MRAVVAAAFVAVAACTQAGGEASNRHEAARRILATSCGECHTGGSPTAVAAALAVFDVTAADWAARMSEAQLREASRRLTEPFGPTQGPEEVRPLLVSDEDRRLFDAVVADELRKRTPR